METGCVCFGAVCGRFIGFVVAVFVVVQAHHRAVCTMELEDMMATSVRVGVVAVELRVHDAKAHADYAWADGALSVTHIGSTQSTMEGAGVRLERAFGFQDPEMLDPFLLLDDFREAGGRAAELISGFQNADVTRDLARQLHERDLMASLGSDFHFPGGHLAPGSMSPTPRTSVAPVWTHPRLAAWIERASAAA